MADNNIKKIKIPFQELPAINTAISGYEVRYRIVSDDKNRKSAWSPMNIVAPNLMFTSGSLGVSSSGSLVTIAWDAASIVGVGLVSEYDVWLRWDTGDSGDWIYKQRTSSTTITLPKPSTYTKSGIDQLTTPTTLAVEIFLKGQPPSRSATYLRIYNPTGFSV